MLSFATCVKLVVRANTEQEALESSVNLQTLVKNVLSNSHLEGKVSLQVTLASCQLLEAIAYRLDPTVVYSRVKLVAKLRVTDDPLNWTIL